MFLQNRKMKQVTECVCDKAMSIGITFLRLIHTMFYNKTKRAIDKVKIIHLYLINTQVTGFRSNFSCYQPIGEIMLKHLTIILLTEL